MPPYFLIFSHRPSLIGQSEYTYACAKKKYLLTKVAKKLISVLTIVNLSTWFSVLLLTQKNWKKSTFG